MIAHFELIHLLATKEMKDSECGYYTTCLEAAVVYLRELSLTVID